MPIVIDVKIPKLTKATSELSNFKAAVDASTKAVSQLNQMLLKTQAIAGGINLPSAPTSKTPKAPGSPNAKKGAPPIADPKAAMRLYARAAAAGDPRAIKFFSQAQRMQNALSKGQAAAQSFMGGGHGAADLVTKLIGGHGGGIGAIVSKIAPLAGAAGLATMALSELGSAAQEARDVLNKWGNALTSGGGTADQARTASRIHDATGVSAAGFAKGLTPIGAGMIGANPVQGPFGNMNYSETLIKGFEFMQTFEKSIEGFNKARRAAELMGSPELANAAYLSPEIAAMVTRQQKSGATYENIAAAKNFDASSGAISDSLKSMIVSIGAPVLKSAAQAFEKIERALSKVPWNMIATQLSKAIEFVGIASTATIEFWSMVYDKVKTVWEYIMNLIPAKLKEAVGLGDSAKAVDRNTQAVDQNTQAIKQGTFGGGERAGRAVPGRMSPSYNQNYAKAAYGIL